MIEASLSDRRFVLIVSLPVLSYYDKRVRSSGSLLLENDKIARDVPKVISQGTLEGVLWWTSSMAWSASPLGQGWVIVLPGDSEACSLVRAWSSGPGWLAGSLVLFSLVSRVA